jgi:2-polyprenyl-3-methyl-5-hydroxy-6-metoxy-1,4-benzoquinol methylase
MAWFSRFWFKVFKPAAALTFALNLNRNIMINNIHARIRRPEMGWDPVPLEHASKYGDAVWQVVDNVLLDKIENLVGGFAGKRVLDLGGGPGQYSVAFARRGGKVVWHDVSQTYLRMAQEKAVHFGVSDCIKFSLGYMDEAPIMLPEQYDFVFNRICWNYGFTDNSFAKVIYQMIRPGGFGYVDSTHSGFMINKLSNVARIRTWLNNQFAVKIGHPFPPHGRLAKLFLKYPVTRLEVDYSSPLNDRVFFEKSTGNT